MKCLVFCLLICGGINKNIAQTLYHSPSEDTICVYYDWSPKNQKIFRVYRIEENNELKLLDELVFSDSIVIDENLGLPDGITQKYRLDESISHKFLEDLEGIESSVQIISKENANEPCLPSALKLTIEFNLRMDDTILEQDTLNYQCLLKKFDYVKKEDIFRKGAYWKMPKTERIIGWHSYRKWIKLDCYSSLTKFTDKKYWVLE